MLRRIRQPRTPDDAQLDPLANALVDAAVESYVEWREASIDVDSAYGRWRTAPVCGRASAFSAYVAALDGEERACEMHARMLRWLSADMRS